MEIIVAEIKREEESAVAVIHASLMPGRCA